MGDVAEMSLRVPASSGVVEEPAAVYAARLAQLAARRAKKGAKTVSSAPVANESAEPRRPKPLTGEGDQDQAGAARRFCNALSLFFELSNTHPDDWGCMAERTLMGRLLSTCILLCIPCLPLSILGLHSVPCWALDLARLTLTLSSGIN